MQKVEERAPLKIDAPHELRTEVKIHAARQGITMREYVLEALRQKLDGVRQIGSK